REASVYQLEQRMLETLFEVEQAYWELVFAYENLRVKMRSLRTAQDLLEENRIRLKVGVIARLAVLQSETGVVVREEEVIVAQSRVEDAKDLLVKVTNLFPEQLIWDVEIVPTDEPFALPPEEHVERDQISAALTNRPELKQLLKQQEAAQLGVRFAKNQLLPALDLIASVGLIGLDEDFDTSILPRFFAGLPLPPPPDKGIDPAFDDLFSGENFQWMVGFKFELPWGSRFERGQYRAANLQVSQLDAGILNLRQLIIQDTRNALRRVETDWKRVVSTRETTRFRRKSLEAERKKFEVGVSTAHELLKFEEELAGAEAGERRAIIDYNLSLSNLLRATGTLLQVRNVQVTVDT
ncbi:MAG: TolC family protein, partial [Candidatus Hydrogenedentota bacterium]